MYLVFDSNFTALPSIGSVLRVCPGVREELSLTGHLGNLDRLKCFFWQSFCLFKQQERKWIWNSFRRVFIIKFLSSRISVYILFHWELLSVKVRTELNNENLRLWLPSCYWYYECKGSLNDNLWALKDEFQFVIDSYRLCCFNIEMLFKSICFIFQ